MARAPRWLRRAIVSMAFGVVATVSVAWGLSLFPPKGGWVKETFHADGWTKYMHVFEVEVVVFHRPGVTRRCWMTFAHEHFASDREFERVVAGAGPPNLAGTINHNPAVRPKSTVAWGRAEDLLVHTQRDVPDGCEHAVGWPWPAACYEFDETTITAGSLPGAAKVRGGVVVEPSRSFPASLWELRVVPLRPIALGAVMDWAVYGLACFGALSLLAAVRRWRRRRLHRCLACGYALSGLPGGSACPECGHAASTTHPCRSTSPSPAWRAPPGPSARASSRTP